MNRHLMGGLLALYPRAFRDRYGTDLASLTDDLISAGEFTPLLATLDLLGGAALEWGRVLTCSRHAAQAMTVAAIMAVAGSMYVMSHVRPRNTPASVHGVSAPAVIGPSARRMARGAPAPVMEVVPGKLSTGPQPLPVAAGVSSQQPRTRRRCKLAGRCRRSQRRFPGQTDPLTGDRGFPKALSCAADPPGRAARVLAPLIGAADVPRYIRTRGFAGASAPAPEGSWRWRSGARPSAGPLNQPGGNPKRRKQTSGDSRSPPAGTRPGLQAYSSPSGSAV